MHFKILNDINPIHIMVGIGALIVSLVATNVHSGINLFFDYQKLQTLTESSSDSSALKLQFDQINNQNERLESWVGSQSKTLNSESFPDLVLMVAKQTGIKNISKLSTTPTEEAQDYSERYQISLSGSYPRIMRFLNKLELSAIPIRITQAEMKSISDTQISCDLKLGVLNTSEPLKADIH